MKLTSGWMETCGASNWRSLIPPHRWLVLHTTATQMKWITQIILKDLKIGKASEFILKDFHPDAPVRCPSTANLSLGIFLFQTGSERPWAYIMPTCKYVILMDWSLVLFRKCGMQLWIWRESAMS